MTKTKQGSHRNVDWRVIVKLGDSVQHHKH